MNLICGGPTIAAALGLGHRRIGFYLLVQRLQGLAVARWSHSDNALIASSGVSQVTILAPRR